MASHRGTQRRAAGHPIEACARAEAVQVDPANAHSPGLVDALLHLRSWKEEGDLKGSDDLSGHLQLWVRERLERWL